MENSENKDNKNIFKQAQQIIITVSGILGSILVLIQIDEKTGAVSNIWNGFQQFLENTYNILAVAKSNEIGFITFLISVWGQVIVRHIKIKDKKDAGKSWTDTLRIGILYTAIVHSTIIIVSYWFLFWLTSLGIN